MAFGQELKDFVAAFSKGYDTVRSPQEREAAGYDLELKKAKVQALPIEQEYREAQLAHLKRQTELAGQSKPMDPIDVAYKRSLIDKNNATTALALGYDPDASSIIGAAREAYGAPQRGSALPAEALPLSGEPSGGDSMPYSPPEGKPPAVGAVNAMATGKDIPQAGSYLGGEDGGNADLGDDYTVYAFNAVRDGLEDAAATAGIKKGAVDSGEGDGSAVRNYLSGKGAAPGSLVQQVGQIIDPEGKMTLSERNMRALGFVHKYYMDKGDTEKAKKAASSLLQFYRMAAQRYAGIAAAAADGGDLDGAARAMVQAYAWVPDGRDVKIVKNEQGGYAFQVTDAHGKTIQKGILTPQELGALAMNVSPTNFDEYIITAAGEKPEKKDAASNAFVSAMAGLDRGQEASAEVLAGMSKDEQDRYDKARKTLGRGELTPEILGRIDTQAYDATEEFLGRESGQRLARYYEGVASLSGFDVPGTLRTATAGILANSRNRLTATQAAEAAADLLHIDTRKPGMPQHFKVTKTKDAGYVKVKVGSHPEFEMRTEDYERLGSMWATARQEAITKLGENTRKAESSNKSWDRMSDAWGRVADDFLSSDFARNPGVTVAEGMKSGVKRAVQGISDSITQPPEFRERMKANNRAREAAERREKERLLRTQGSYSSGTGKIIRRPSFGH